VNQSTEKLATDSANSVPTPHSAASTSSTSVSVDDLSRSLHEIARLFGVDQSSIFSVPPWDLNVLAIAHGIEPLRDSASTRRQLLYHLFEGRCFPVSPYSAFTPGCASLRRGHPAGHRLSSNVLSFVLSTVQSDARLREYCVAKGLTQDELNASPSRENLINYLTMHQAGVPAAYSNGSVIEHLDRLSTFELLLLSRLHRVEVCGSFSKSHLKDALVGHIVCSDCTLPIRPASRGCVGCTVDTSTFCVAGRNRLLKELLLERRIPLPSLRRVLVSVTKQPFDGTLSECRKLLNDYRLAAVKMPRNRMYSARPRNPKVRITRDVDDVHRDWPYLVNEDEKAELIDDFLHATSSDALRQYICALCGELKDAHDMHDTLTPVSDVDLEVIRTGYPHTSLDPFDGDDELRGGYSLCVKKEKMWRIATPHRRGLRIFREL
jgi:hypothetical protein